MNSMDFKLLVSLQHIKLLRKKYADTYGTEQKQNFFYYSAIFKCYLGYY